MTEPIAPLGSSPERWENYVEATDELQTAIIERAESEIQGVGQDASAVKYALDGAYRNENVSDAEFRQLSLLAQDFALNDEAYANGFFAELKEAESLKENPSEDDFLFPEPVSGNVSGEQVGNGRVEIEIGLFPDPVSPAISDPDRDALRSSALQQASDVPSDNPTDLSQVINNAYANTDVSDREFAGLVKAIGTVSLDGSIDSTDIKTLRTDVEASSRSTASRDRSLDSTLSYTTSDSIDFNQQNPGDAEAATRDLAQDLFSDRITPAGDGSNSNSFYSPEVTDNELSTFRDEVAERAVDGDIDFQDLSQLEQLADRLTATFDENGARVNSNGRNPLDQQQYSEDPYANNPVMTMAVMAPEAERSRDFAAVVAAFQNTDGLYSAQNPGDAERGARYLLGDALSNNPATDTPDNIDAAQITNQEFSDLSQYAVQLAADGDFDWEDLSALNSKIETKI
jgi:hypothetical protein